MLQNGKGTDQNYSKAIKYYEKSINLGNSNAMYNCVLMLQNSLRNECNSFEAAKYYEMVMELEKSDVMYPSFI